MTSEIDEAGGAGPLAKGIAGAMLPETGVGGLVMQAAGALVPGDSGGGEGGLPGVGKGRRMPVQQSVDVAVALETAYNQWTQFEDWPEFMHRVTRVTQFIEMQPRERGAWRGVIEDGDWSRRTTAPTTSSATTPTSRST